MVLFPDLRAARTVNRKPRVSPPEKDIGILDTYIAFPSARGMDVKECRPLTVLNDRGRFAFAEAASPAVGNANPDRVAAGVIETT